ncbi:hypothetical protein BDZ91DRAFT_792049 [Kalaharituber pfeilii]|nr:hypothetical protein BDZ91DRAFT_792049 [Kalaharituber pfeilii]
MEAAGLTLAIFTLSTKAAQFVWKAYDAYNSVERDEFLLKLDMEKHKFSEWVRSRRFTSRRALEHRMRMMDKTKIKQHDTIAEISAAEQQLLKIPGSSISRNSSTLSVDTMSSATSSVKPPCTASFRREHSQITHGCELEEAELCGGGMVSGEKVQCTCGEAWSAEHVVFRCTELERPQRKDKDGAHVSWQSWKDLEEKGWKQEGAEGNPVEYWFACLDLG